jgi:hypothetical protein
LSRASSLCDGLGDKCGAAHVHVYLAELAETEGGDGPDTCRASCTAVAVSCTSPWPRH